MKKLVGAILLASIVTGGVQPINAGIVNIDARTNSTTNPVVMFFDAGTYEVTPIGVSDGGTYNAWNPWIGDYFLLVMLDG